MTAKRRTRRHPGVYRSEVPVGPTTLPLLQEMRADGRLSADHIMVRDGRAVMALTDTEIDRLREAGFQVAVGADLIAQARHVKAQRVRSAPTVEDHGLHVGHVTQYLDTAGIVARFAALHAEFPALTSWTNLPHSTGGYDGSYAPAVGAAVVKLFRITTTPLAQSKPGLLVIAGTHAREWIPPLAAIEFAEQLLRTYSPGSVNPVVQGINQLVENLDILIIPAMNPDGINYSHHDFAMWRKNRHPAPTGAPATCDGVDNNRNFSVYWGQAGSTNDPCNDSYRGAATMSEPENRNVLYVIEQYPNLLTAADCHSFGEDIFRAHPAGGLFISSEPVEASDHAIFLGLEAAMNAAISSVTPGKTYSTGTTNNHAGTCDDYLFLAHRIFGFTIECAQDFQPPIAAGLVAVQEVTAALRALAGRTLALAPQFVSPVSIVQVIDRSGSMVAAGYVDSVRANAKRLIDLMSLNDSTALVSFNQTATIHTPLTTITNPGVYASVRSSVDAIAFQGLTSIGAGLQSAGTALAGSNGPKKAIVLLSDGYQNRPPTVADALSALPGDVRVHTIALGPLSDQALLEMIADATGGRYYFTPDELELHEMYNYIRAAAAEEEVVFNETVITPAGDSSFTQPVVIEDGAASVTFAISWYEPARDVQVELRPPYGPMPDLTRLRRIDGHSHKVLRLRRPQPGVWSVDFRFSAPGPFPCAVGVFLRSDLRLRVIPAAKTFVVGKPIRVWAQVQKAGKFIGQLSGTTALARPAASLSTLIRDSARGLPRVPQQQLRRKDALPLNVLQALLIRDRLRHETKGRPITIHSRARQRATNIID